MAHLVFSFRLAAVLLAAPIAIGAQTAYIPLDDPVYRDLDRLIGLGVIETPIVTQRPYSRREIARMLESASRAVESENRTLGLALARTLVRARRRFAADIAALPRFSAPDPRVHYGSRWRTDIMGLSSPSRRIPDDSLGRVDALINPLIDGDGGREQYNGASFAWEFEAEGPLSRRASFRVRPRFLAGTHAGETMTRGSLQGLSATVRIRNFLLEAGRQQVVWGQGMDGGLLFSASSKPLDMVRVSTDRLFRIPYFSDVFGPLRGDAFIADLGERQRYPHSLLIAYKASGLPRSWLEMSIQVLAEVGGRGGPRTSFGEYVKDLIPPLKYTLPDDTTQFSNKFAGWEERIRFPGRRGIQLYAEHMLDDADPRRWKSTFWEDGGHIAGLSVAQLGADGAWSGALELQHTGVRFYQHAIYPSGIAFNQTLTGSPLGNDANGAMLRLRRDGGGVRALTIDLGVDRRSGHVMGATWKGDFEDFRFVVLERRPAEWRGRLVVGTSSTIGDWRQSWRAGVEQVRNHAFQPGTRHNFIVAGRIEAIRP